MSARYGHCRPLSRLTKGVAGGFVSGQGFLHRHADTPAVALVRLAGKQALVVVTGSAGDAQRLRRKSPGSPPTCGCACCQTGKPCPATISRLATTSFRSTLASIDSHPFLVRQAHHEWSRRWWHIGQLWDLHSLTRDPPAV